MTFYIIIGLLLAAFSLFMLWLFVVAKINVWLKISAFTILVCMCVYISFGIKTILGYPTFDEMPDGAKIVSISRSLEDESKLYLWLLLEHEDIPRAYEVTFSDDDKNALLDAQAQASKEKGQVIIHKKKLTKEEKLKKKTDYKGIDGGNNGSKLIIEVKKVFHDKEKPIDTEY